jgi:predicted dehydrogenase
MCEKPMAINASEAKKMVDAAKRTGKMLTIGYQNRQRKDAKYLKAEADEGVFGDIYYAKATALRRRAVPTWGVFIKEDQQGGGPLIDIGTHALDLTLWTMNNYKPKYCVGTTYHKLNDQKESANVFGQWKPEEFTVEDSAFGFIVMENGATIVLESSWAINMTETKEACTTICGTKAGAKMVDQGVLEINGVKHNQMYETRPNLDGKGVAFYDAGGYSAGAVEAQQWINAVINGTKPTVLPEQAFCVTQILEGIYESAKTGKPYYFN